MNSSSLGYASFSLSEEEEAEKQKKHFTEMQTRSQLIQNHVKKHQLIELKSDYLGMDSYYLDQTTAIVYKVCNVGSGVPEFIITNDSHILRLNGLLSDNVIPEMESRIKNRKMNDQLYKINSYGGMGMDSASANEKINRLEELNYMNRHKTKPTWCEVEEYIREKY